jgi:hypothetical protein
VFEYSSTTRLGKFDPTCKMIPDALVLGFADARGPKIQLFSDLSAKIEDPCKK